VNGYVFKWRAEALFAIATFAVYIGSAFVATGNTPVTDWSDWFVGVCVAGARVVVAALLVPITSYLSGRGGI
jgi:hypothetical protein